MKLQARIKSYKRPVLIKAHKIIIPGYEQFSFFVYRYQNGFTIAEWQTGIAIYTYRQNSARDAFIAAKDKLDYLNPTDIESTIQGAIEKYGVVNHCEEES